MRKKMKMTNADAVNLYNVVSSLRVQGRAKFAFALAKTKQYLKPVAESLEEARTQFMMTDGYKRFQEAQQNLVKKYAVNADGTPCTRQDADGRITRTVPLTKQGDYVQATEQLAVEFKDVLDAAQANNEEFIGVLNTEIDVEVYSVPLSEFPDNQIDQNAFNILYPLVDEDTTAEKNEGPK